MKKSLKVLALVMLLITIWQISVSYAKFYTQAHATFSSNVGDWKIKINEMDIYSENGDKVSFVIDKLKFDKNSYTVENKIAPGREGYFSINIDPEGTSVAVRYDIDLNMDEFNSLTEQNNKILISVEEGLRNNQIIRTGENTYTAIIKLEDINANKKDDVRIKVKWENSDENNLVDTETGNEYGKNISIPVEVTVSQYLGEEIIPYI